MKNGRKKIITPSELYRMRRPKYFSDTKITKENELPKEILAFELEKLTTNQKESEFETLCRKLAEKLIAPNLIPQVGPTGGGDGKTDSETYPVSEHISNRWFVPENGWDNNEKWAFAFSAKKTWKTKAKSDIKKIIETNRDYTRIYFITNQSPSSKKRKDAQDEFIDEFKIDIVILCSRWIIEKVYENKLINIVVNSLNLSQSYLKETRVIGRNDSSRVARLKELEKQIEDPKRYFEYDFQIIEDSLEAAIICRMLEKPRDEVEGKFDRVRRFCEKVNFKKHWIKYHYQRAWTYINFYDDYSLFVEEFTSLRKLISDNSSITEIELYFNLFNLMRGISSFVNLEELGINLKEEYKKITDVLKSTKSNSKKPCSALIAETYIAFIVLTNLKENKQKCDSVFKTFISIIKKSSKFFEYPFEIIKKMLEELGEIFPHNIQYDNLIDIIAIESEKRNSELAAGEIFLNRARQKFKNKYYKESIVYFGKSLIKLAKEESSYGMYLSLIGLGFAYSELGLVWASYNSFVTAAHKSIRVWFESGEITKQAVRCIKQLSKQELLIGRIPIFLSWFEMYKILSTQINYNAKEINIPFEQFLDGCLCTRFLNSDLNYISKQDYLPELLKKRGFFISGDCILFILGYSEHILKEIDKNVISDENELLEYYSLAASQPFRNQIIHKTDFMESSRNDLSTKILGCSFYIHFDTFVDSVLIAETILAFLESFLATTIMNIVPKIDTININLLVNKEDKFPSFTKDNNNYDIHIPISVNDLSEFWDFFISLTVDIIVHNFIVKEDIKYFKKLFEEEELNERMSLILYHSKYVYELLGDSPKFTINDWNKDIDNKFPLINEELPIFTIQEFHNKNNDSDKDDIKLKHNNIKLISIINIELWDKAKWQAFGVFNHPYLGFGLILCFNNEKYAKEIFDEWLSNYTLEELKQIMQITIIKGININHPYWYRVQISPNITKQVSTKNRYFILPSRINEMTPSNSKNLEYIVNTYKELKSFTLYPAKSINGNQFDPFIEKGIKLTNLRIINAWEVGLNDIERAAIYKDDNIIIPSNIENAPVLEILKKKLKDES